MKWCIIFSALLLEATLTLGKIYIREELIHDERALKIREAESVDSRTRTRTRTHTRIPAYSSCILDYDDGGDRVNSILEAKTDAAAMVTITVNPNAPETTITVRPEPDASRDASEFCADFLRHAPTGGAVTKTVLLTSTNTVTVSTAGVTTKTSTNVLPGTTVSALCPIPSTSMTCALSGWGYSTNNIYAGTSIEPPACQQLCLKNTACGSFQVLANNSDPIYTPLCNLYNVTAGGNNTIPGSTSPYAFYDRDCQNFSPSGCTAPKVAMLARDDAASREPTPTFFIGIPSDTLSSVCACVLSTSLGAPPAATRTISSTTFLTKSVTVTLVQTFILTTTVGGTTTVLSSVH